MLISRRHIIALSCATAIATTIGTGSLLISWWKVPPHAPFQCLSIHESKILVAIAQATFPSGAVIAMDAKDLNLDRFFDSVLFGMPTVQSDLLKLLINALNRAPHLSLKAQYLDLSFKEQTLFLKGLLEHEQHLLRSAISSLCILLGMGYTSHPEVSPSFAKYHRCGFGD
jgi:hypothetical protein